MNDTHKDPDQLERQVDDARANLSQTVDALGEQLSPGQLLDQVFSLTKEQGGEFASNLGRQVKDNPLALLLTGVGVTWLVAGSGSIPSGYDSGLHSHRKMPSSMTTSAAASAGASSASAPGDDSIGDRVQAGMDSGAQAIKERASTMSSQFERTLREQPLVMSGLGIALGAALGALIPPSETEDKLMGEKSDQTMSKATEALTEKYEEERDRLTQKAKQAEQAVKR